MSRKLQMYYFKSHRVLFSSLWDSTNFLVLNLLYRKHSTVSKLSGGAYPVRLFLEIVGQIITCKTLVIACPTISEIFI